MRPGAARLAMDVPVVLDDRLDAQQPVGTGLLLAVGHARQQPLALDAAVDDDMGDMEALRPELARHRLDHEAQSALGGVEGGEARPAAQRARGAGEDHRAAAERRQAAHRLAGEQEAGEAADPPGVLEVLRRHLAEIDGGVVAHVEDQQVGRRSLGIVGHRAVEQGDRPRLPSCRRSRRPSPSRRRRGSVSATFSILAAVRPATST